MPLFRYFAVAILVVAAVLLTGALNSQPRRPAPIAPNPQLHAAAVHVLDDALARLDPRRVVWLEAKIWQKGRLERFTFESEGRYLIGPNHRFRLDLTTRHGRAASAVLAVSDGATLWQGRRRDDGPWTDVTRVKLAQGFQTSPAAAEALVSDQIPIAREGNFPRFSQGQFMGGAFDLLQTMRSRLEWSRMETVRREGRAFIKLTGTWSSESAEALAPTGGSWPDGLPQQCRLYLDAETLWPHRVEWWGPDVPRSADVLLLQMEFRDPVLNQPLSAEGCAREFGLPVAAAQPYNP